jgi:mRNA interferase MazF
MARSSQLPRSATSSVSPPYCPDTGDIISINFDPQAGREMAGRHYALVLSPRKYNQYSRLCVLCPATGQVKGYPFEVLLPADLMLGAKGGGCILADQLKSMSWQDRGARFVCTAPDGILQEVVAKCRTLLPL